jgi:hypothetical protein
MTHQTFATGQVYKVSLKANQTPSRNNRLDRHARSVMRHADHLALAIGNQAILVIWLLAQTRIGSFGGRVGFVLIAGILAAITTNVSYWNWYGFPGVYTASYILMELVGFVLVGVTAALVLPKRSPTV